MLQPNTTASTASDVTDTLKALHEQERIIRCSDWVDSKTSVSGFPLAVNSGDHHPTFSPQLGKRLTAQLAFGYV